MTSSPLPIVGFIGLGNMGSGMTRNLQAAGYRLVITDIRRESGDDLVAGGASFVNSAAEVAAASDIVITMLPTPRHVDMVLSGPDGLLAGAGPGLTWIDMSTSVP